MSGNSRSFTFCVVGAVSYLIIYLVQNGKANPSGAPIQTCTHLTPRHFGASSQTTPSPYTISVSPVLYTPGQQMTVTISTNNNIPALKGILLQARRGQTSTNPIIGTWSLGGATDYQYLTCNGASSAVTHTNNNDKPATIQFNWTPPYIDGDHIYFTATFVQSRNVFWVGERTENIQPAPTSCDPNPCLSGGNCIPYQSTFTCNCPALTTGLICNVTLSPCDSDPCLNGGTCGNSADNTTFSCTCPSNYTGPICQPESLDGFMSSTDNPNTTGKGKQLTCSVVSIIMAIVFSTTFFKSI